MIYALNQKKAKILIRQYLEATERRGVTSLMSDIRRHAGTEVFVPRTMEKWLKTQKHMLQEEKWQIVLSFIRSDTFLAHVPQASENSEDDRLRKIAAGMSALYGTLPGAAKSKRAPTPHGGDASNAVALLEGYWSNAEPVAAADLPSARCRISHLSGTGVAKFAFIASLSQKKITATGLAIHHGSSPREGYDYVYTFILQIWRRRDPAKGYTSPIELSYQRLSRDQPKLLIGGALNQHFIRFADRSEANGPSTALTRTTNVLSEENKVIDKLIYNVLPHRYEKQGSNISIGLGAQQMKQRRYAPNGIPDVFAAAEDNDVEALDLSLRFYSVNERDESGLTPLHYAASTLAIKTVERLLRHPDIDATITDEFGRSAATVAFECWDELSDDLVDKLNPHCYPWLYPPGR